MVANVNQHQADGIYNAKVWQLQQEIFVVETCPARSLQRSSRYMKVDLEISWLVIETEKGYLNGIEDDSMKLGRDVYICTCTYCKPTVVNLMGQNVKVFRTCPSCYDTRSVWYLYFCPYRRQLRIVRARSSSWIRSSEATT